MQGDVAGICASIRYKVLFLLDQGAGAGRQLSDTGARETSRIEVQLAYNGPDSGNRKHTTMLLVFWARDDRYVALVDFDLVGSRSFEVSDAVVRNCFDIWRRLNSRT